MKLKSRMSFNLKEWSAPSQYRLVCTKGKLPAAVDGGAAPVPPAAGPRMGMSHCREPNLLLQSNEAGRDTVPAPPADGRGVDHVSPSGSCSRV